MPERAIAIGKPTDWHTATLADVCELIKRGTTPTYVNRSDTYAIGQRCVTDSGFDALFARPHDHRAMRGTLAPVAGDVLLNCLGTGTIGRSCLFNEPGNYIVDSNITLLRPQGGVVDGRWIDAVLKSPWGQRHLDAYCIAGSTNQVGLSRAELSRMAIPLPPFREQRGICGALALLEEEIRSSHRELAKLEDVHQGLLHDLLSLGVVETGRLRDPISDPTQFRETAIGSIPADWDVAPLRSLCELITYGFTNPMPTADKGPWMVTAADIGYGSINWSARGGPRSAPMRATSPTRAGQ